MHAPRRLSQAGLQPTRRACVTVAFDVELVRVYNRYLVGRQTPEYQLPV